MSDRFMLRGGEALGPALSAPSTIMKPLFKIRSMKVTNRELTQNENN